MNVLGSGVKFGSKDRLIKNRSKNEAIMGRHLGIDFSLMLVDFEGQVGAMLRSKIDQNSIQESIEKQMRKGKRLGRVLEAPGGRFDASRNGQGGGIDRRKIWKSARPLNEF